MKTIRFFFVRSVLASCLSFFVITQARADSSTVWEAIGKYAPVKSSQSLKSLKPGDTVVKVCNACKHVTLVHVVSVGQGHYDLQSQKCEYCGSNDTYLAAPSTEPSK